MVISVGRRGTSQADGRPVIFYILIWVVVMRIYLNYKCMCVVYDIHPLFYCSICNLIDTII